jgi:hypothetical protein
MTPADEGAGFTAPTRPPVEGQTSEQIINPVTWDGEAEEMTIVEPEPQRDMEQEIEALLDQLDIVDKLTDHVDTITEKNTNLIQSFKDVIVQLQNQNEVLTFMHNELTAVKEWVDEEYPGDEG